MSNDFASHCERHDGPSVIAFRGGSPSALEETAWHRHLRGQFIYLEAGMVSLRTKQGSWSLLTHRGGWMPPGLLHKVRMAGPTDGWGVFLAPEACRGLPDHPCVLGATDLLRSLTLRAASWANQTDIDPGQQRILDLLLDEVRHAPIEPLHLAMPTDRRLLRISEAVLQAPQDNRTLDDWAAWAGLSSRTLSRLFRRETGNSFAQWRQQARLSHALEQLAEGSPVGHVSDALGYANPSAFIAMFRRVFGSSPKHFLSKGGASQVFSLSG